MRSFDACIFLLSPKSYLRGEASVAPARWLLARSAQTQSGLPLASTGRKPASFPSAGDGSRRWCSRGPDEPELSNAGAASAARFVRSAGEATSDLLLWLYQDSSRLPAFFFFPPALKMATRESREGPWGELPGAAVPSATSWVAVNHGSVPSHTHFWSCAPEAAVVTGPRALPPAAGVCGRRPWHPRHRHVARAPWPPPRASLHPSAPLLGVPVIGLRPRNPA